MTKSRCGIRQLGNGLGLGKGTRRGKTHVSPKVLTPSQTIWEIVMGMAKKVGDK